MGSKPTPSTIPDPSSLPALRTNPKYIFFTDFDGTITLQDSNDFLTDNIGFGYDARAKEFKDVLSGGRDFRDAFQVMMDSIHAPFNECVDLLLKNVELDPKFKGFWRWCREHNIPVVILSGGMEPIIRALLGKLLVGEGGESQEALDDVQIVSNNVKARPGKGIDEVDGWDIEYHDDSGFGHDKSLEIRKYSHIPADQRPFLFYAGDGVSDLSAARETDLMFAREGKDLVTYCEKEKIPFTTFKDFGGIHKIVEDIVSGKVPAKQAALGRH